MIHLHRVYVSFVVQGHRSEFKVTVKMFVFYSAESGSELGKTSNKVIEATSNEGSTSQTCRCLGHASFKRCEVLQPPQCLNCWESGVSPCHFRGTTRLLNK